MKLNFGKKLVLFMHWLFSLLGCALAVMMCVWPALMAKQFDSAYNAIGKRNMDIIGVALLVIYAALAIATVLIIFSGNGRRGERGFITVDSSDTGKTRIAVGAVEQMIRQAVHGVEGIADMKTSITNNQDAISIDARVAILNGAHVPTVTMNIQRSIRSYIELNCGVAVRDVSVSVHSLTNEDGSRHGRKKFAPQGTAMPTPVEPENMDAAYAANAQEAQSADAFAPESAAREKDAPVNEVQDASVAPDESVVADEQNTQDAPDASYEPDTYDTQDTTARIPDELIDADPTAKDPFGFHTDDQEDIADNDRQ